MLGHRIASLRKKMGISQTELAQKICISSSAIGMYEQGRREPSIAIIIALSRELNVSIDFLLTGRNWSQKDDCADAILICQNSRTILCNDRYTIISISDEKFTPPLSSVLKAT